MTEQTTGLIRKIIIRTVMFIGLLGLLTVGVLKLIEYSPNQLRQGFESYLTQAAGYPADIEKLNRVQFFPNLWFDMDDIRFWPIEDPEGSVLNIGSAQLRMPLWSVLIGSPRFSALSVSDVNVSERLTGSDELIIRTIAIDAGQDVMQMEGSVGDAVFDAALPLIRPSPAAPVYYVPQSPLRISGTLNSGKTRGHYFIDLNQDDYGITVTFAQYRPEDMAEIVTLAETLLKGRDGEAFPVRVDIQKLLGSSGQQGGPYVFEQISLDKDGLQPFRCLMNSRNKSAGNPHPCAKQE